MVVDRFVLEVGHIWLLVNAIFHLGLHLENCSLPISDVVCLCIIFELAVDRKKSMFVENRLPLSSRTKDSSSAILFRRRVLSSSDGSSLKKDRKKKSQHRLFLGM